MKNNCDMARDLMPLTIDGVASEASQTYVKEHLEECAECRAYLEGMKAALHDDSRRVEAERVDFSRTVSHMKRRRWLKRAAIALIAVVIAIAGLYGGIILYSHYNMQPIELTASEYSASLAQLEDGRVVMTAQTYNKPIARLYVQDMRDENGGRVGTVMLMSQRGYSNLHGELMVYEFNSLNGYQSIRYGAGAPVTLWTSGDAITPASPEMEAYYKARDAVAAFDSEVERRHMIEQAETGNYGEIYRMTPEEAEESDRLSEAFRATFNTVPEWNSGAGWSLQNVIPMG